MGDPAGVGPEITAKALARAEVQSCCRPLLVGDAALMAEAIALVSAPLELNSITDPADAQFDPGRPDIIDLGNIDSATLKRGEVSAEAGRASVDYIKRAVEIVMAGQADAIVTGPSTKPRSRRQVSPTLATPNCWPT